MEGKIAYQGESGAFGEEACSLFVPGRPTLNCPSFKLVVQAVLEGKADLGMLPIENSCAGTVPGIRDILAGSAVRVVRRVDLPVRMHLLAQEGARLEGIRTVASHAVALAQCGKALRELGVETEEASNTAAAAKELAGSHEAGDRAVLASERAAAAYGLTILKRDLQDRPDNITTFAVIARGQ
ncbi:MAG: prephenate dehydratase [Pseudomonadota bacterium]|nr:prephenate dehydratase [Pseudomonadota bacterium]